MPLPRRSLLAGFGLMLAAPAIVRAPGLLMPARPMRSLHGLRITNLAPPAPNPVTLEQVWATLDNHNRFAEYLRTERISREQAEQEYPMTGEV